MFNAKKRLVLLTQVIIWLSVTATAFGQAAPPKPMSEAEFIALLQSRIKQVDDLRDLDDAAKAKVKESVSAGARRNGGGEAVDGEDCAI